MVLNQNLDAGKEIGCYATLGLKDFPRIKIFATNYGLHYYVLKLLLTKHNFSEGCYCQLQPGFFGGLEQPSLFGSTYFWQQLVWLSDLMGLILKLKFKKEYISLLPRQLAMAKTTKAYPYLLN